MSTEGLKDRLDALQCHFTWQLGVEGCFSPPHVLQKLAVELRHTAHQNQAALLGLQAYLQQLSRQSTQALESLQAAQDHSRAQQEPEATASSVVIHGNYAWIHYLQASYEEAERSLERVQQLCPSPGDPRLTPYIEAQKGWSLLAIRAKNGDRARKCFEVALELEPENVHFQAGLGKALYFSWSNSRCSDIRNKAIIQLEKIVHMQPNNYRAKIHLAWLLEKEDKERSIDLIKECAEKSSDPEVLKSAASFWLPQATERAMEILQRVLQQDPEYHLLYLALARCYKYQWLNAKEQDKNNILDTAIEHLQEIVQNHPDLELTLVKLLLAELIGAREPAREEQMYRELHNNIDTLSLKCRQALNVFWGRFLLYKKKALNEAKVKFMAGYEIPLLSEQRKECGWRLEKMAVACHSRGDTATADAIRRFVQETDRNLAQEFSGLSLD